MIWWQLDGPIASQFMDFSNGLTPLHTCACLVWFRWGDVMKTKVVSKWSGGDLAWQVWHKYLYALSIPSLFFLFTRTSSVGRHTLVFLLQTCFLVCAYFPPSLVVVSTFLMTHHQGKRAVKSNPTFLPYNDNSLSLFMCSLSVESK